jgi:hypothetical protein
VHGLQAQSLQVKRKGAVDAGDGDADVVDGHGLILGFFGRKGN